MTTDFRSLCAALLDEISHESPTTCLARAALAEPESEGPQPMPVSDAFAVVQRRLDQLASDQELMIYRWPDGDWTIDHTNPERYVQLGESSGRYSSTGGTFWEAVNNLAALLPDHAALAEPQPEPPTDGEVAELVVWLLDGGEDAAANGWDHQARQELKQLFDDHSGYINDEQVMWWSDFHAAARAVLARWSSDGPAVQSMEPASVVTEPSDEDLHSLWLELYAFQEGVTSGDVTEIARAVLARWGQLPISRKLGVDQ